MTRLDSILDDIIGDEEPVKRRDTDLEAVLGDILGDDGVREQQAILPGIDQTGLEQQALEQTRSDELFQSAREAEIGGDRITTQPLKRFNQIRRELNLPEAEDLPEELLDGRTINNLKGAISEFAQFASRGVEGIADAASALTELAGLDTFEEITGIPFGTKDVNEFFAASRNVIKAYLPDDPRLREEYLSQLSRGVGSAGGFVAASIAGGPALLATLALGSGAQEQAEAARAAGADETATAVATVLGTFLGLTDIIPAGRYVRALKPIDRVLKGKFFNAILNKGGVLVDIVTEGLQEFGQEAGSNVIAKQILKQDRDLFEGAPEAGGVGAGVGGLLGTIVRLLGRIAGVKTKRIKIKSPEAQKGAAQAGKLVDEATPEQKPTIQDIPTEEEPVIEATGPVKPIELKEKTDAKPSEAEAASQAEAAIVERTRQLQRGGLSQTAAKRRAEAEQPAPEPVTPVTTPPVDEVTPVPDPEPTSTSIKNEVVDREREKRGLRPAMETARQDLGTVWDEAMRLIDNNPRIQDALIKKMEENPQAATPIEVALLLHRQIELHNEEHKILLSLDEAQQAGNDGRIIDFQSQHESITAELLQLYDVNKSSGTAAGRALQARKLMADEEFSLVRMIAKKRKAMAVDQLSTEDNAAVKVAQQAIADLELKLQQHVARISELQAEQASREAVQKLIPSQADKPKRKRAAAAKIEVEAAWKDFEGKISGKLFANPLDPQIIASAAKLAKAYIKSGVANVQDFIDLVVKRIGIDRATKLDEALKRAWDTAKSESKPRPKGKLDTPAKVSNLANELAEHFVENGVTDREQLIDEVHKELLQVFPEITRRQAMDAISKYGQFSPLSTDEIKVTLRDLKGQMQQIGKLEDIQEGQAPLKTGVERRTPSDTERRLIQQVNEMKKQSGLEVTDPAKQLQSALGAVKTRLNNQIADLEKQIADRQKIVKKRTDIALDAEAKQLIKRRDTLKKQFDDIFGKPGLTDEQRIRSALSSTKRSINELQRRIAEKDVTPRKRKSKTPFSEELKALQDTRDALKAEFKELQDTLNPKKTPQERSLSALKTRLRTRIADFQQRLATQDFVPKARRETVLDEEAERLRFEAERAKAEFMRELDADKRRRRTIPQKIFGAVPELLNTSRTLLTTADLSAVLRQGVIFVFSHPIRTSKALGTMFSAARSEAGASRARNQIEQRANAAIYKRHGLEFTGTDQKLSQREESFMSLWAKQIPLAGRVIAGSERAFVSFLNRIRADAYDVMAATMGKGGTVTLEEGKAIANYVNVATGRGDLGRFKGAATVLSTAFFAPRFVLSRFQYVTLQPLRKGVLSKGNTFRVRKLIAAEYGRTLTGAATFFAMTIAALIAMIGPPGEDKEWDIETDSNSSDFLKIRIGNVRYDVLGGLQQVTVFMSRLATGKFKKVSGETVPLRGEGVPFGGGAGPVLGRFLRTKLSPWLGTGVSFLTGKTLSFEDVTVATTARDLLVPISMRDIHNYMIEQGVPAGTVTSIIEMFGASVQQFESGPKSIPIGTR